MSKKKHRNTPLVRLKHRLRTSGRSKYWQCRVLLRDKYMCRRCGFDRTLTTHHIFTIQDFIAKHGLNREKIMSDPLFFDVGNGITLCERCHHSAHTGKSHPTFMRRLKWGIRRAKGVCRFYWWRLTKRLKCLTNHVLIKSKVIRE